MNSEEDVEAYAEFPSPPPFEILEKDGQKIASNGERQVILLDPEGRMFKRRAIKRAGSSQAEAVEWCVVELNGVRVYVDGENVVVTTLDLQP
jgi:hypothetical protein